MDVSKLRLIPKGVKALEQCERDAKGEDPCIVVTRQDINAHEDMEEETFVVMRWETFKELIGKRKGR